MEVLVFMEPDDEARHCWFRERFFGPRRCVRTSVFAVCAAASAHNINELQSKAEQEDHQVARDLEAARRVSAVRRRGGDREQTWCLRS